MNVASQQALPPLKATGGIIYVRHTCNIDIALTGIHMVLFSCGQRYGAASGAAYVALYVHGHGKRSRQRRPAAQVRRRLPRRYIRLPVSAADSIAIQRLVRTHAIQVERSGRRTEVQPV